MKYLPNLSRIDTRPPVMSLSSDQSFLEEARKQGIQIIIDTDMN